MKPSPFTMLRAGSADEAIAALREHGDDAKILAGGQSLVAMMNLRLAAPARLVDIMRAEDLRGIERTNGRMAIRAGVRQAEVEDDRGVRAAVPLLTEALAHVAHREIRNAGTVCGSVAHADAAAELPAACLALDAELVARSARGTRTIPAAEFFRAYLTTALEPDELLTEIRFPVDGPRTGSAFAEIAPRHGDYALAGAAAVVTLDPAGIVTRCSLALLGVASTPVRAAAAETALTGVAPTDDVLDEAAAAVATQLQPHDDVHATADYRRHAAGVLTRRVLRTAIQRAGEEAR